MATKLVINVSKKIPGPSDYSSTSASCSIESECPPDQAVTEAARLYAQAEQAVDRQLGLTAVPPPTASPPPSANPPSWPRSSSMPSSSRPAPGRRGMPSATASQLKLLGHLLSAREGQAAAILHHYQVTDLSQLTVKQASETIDTLKAEGAHR